MNDCQNDEEKQLKKELYKKLISYIEYNPSISKSTFSTDSKLFSIAKELNILNENLLKADSSSKKLTIAIKNLTKASVIIAAIGVFVAIFSLIFEIIKFINE